jgi:hypothetical protein
MAALKLNDRVCQIRLSLGWDSGSELDEIFAALEEPFPALTDLNLYTCDNGAWGPISISPNPASS